MSEIVQAEPRMLQPASDTAFVFEGMAIRTGTIDGVVYFCAIDVAARLGYLDPKGSVASHCKGETKYLSLQTRGGKQSLRVIAEMGSRL